MFFKFVKIVLSSIFLLPFTSAQSSDTNAFFTGLGNWFSSTFSFLFSTKEIATKTLMGILFFMVIYTSVDLAFRKKWIFTTIITSIVTILSIIWIPDGFLGALTTQYGALGTTIITIIPLIIIVVFTFRFQSDIVGRALWVFYCLYYFGLIIYNVLSSNQSFFSVANIPYLVAFIGGMVMFFAMPAIRQAIFKGELSQIKKEGEIIASRSKILHKLQKKELEAYDVEARTTKDEF